MILQEKHKEFVVKSFAHFMTRTEVVEAFIAEFADDLPQPPPIPEFPHTKEDYNDDDSIEAKLAKDLFITKNVQKYGSQYHTAYPNEGSPKFEEDYDKILAEIEKAYTPENKFAEAKRKHFTNHQNKVKSHNKKVKQNLSSQLRRFHIKHPQFPAKYRPLFNQARKEYFISYQSESLKQPENLLFEMETLYGYVKERIFNAENPKEVMKHLDLAHNILKTIIANNAIDTKQDIVDVTPQKKALEDK